MCAKRPDPTPIQAAHGPTVCPPEWLAPSAPPIILDIGCHRGLFLETLASANPGSNFLGVEKLSERVGRTRRRIQHLPNAAVRQGGGLETVAALPSGRIFQIHILFPDPWPKRRHWARRLLSPPFLSECSRILQPGGLLRILTDHEGYARHISTLLKDQSTLQPNTTSPLFPPSAFQQNFDNNLTPYWEFLLDKAE